MEILKSRSKDLGGGLIVSRVLPGHPHIGLATATWLFEGELVHRDSLGVVQPIAPGDANWMTAGRGIVHSERADPQRRKSARRMYGIQSWVALPKAHEDDEPSFSHHPAASLPRIRIPGADLRLIAGDAFGERSPAPALSRMFYLAAELEPGAVLTLPPEHEQRGVYLVQGSVAVAGEPLSERHLAFLPEGDCVEIRVASRSRIMLLGGEKMDGGRFIWWNFVASSKVSIETAKQRWREQRFPRIPGETEFVPLPEH